MEQSMSHAVIVAIIFSSVAIAGVHASPPIVDPGNDRDDSDNDAELCIDTHGIIVGCDDDDTGDEDGDGDDEPSPSPPDTTPVSPPTSQTPSTSTPTRTMMMPDVPTDESMPTDASTPTDTSDSDGTDPVVGDPMETATPTQRSTQTVVSNTTTSETQSSDDDQTVPTTPSGPSETEAEVDDTGGNSVTNQSTPTITASTHRTVGHSSPTDSDDTITTPTITTIDGARDTSTPSHMPASILRAIGIGAVLMSGAAYSSSLSIPSALYECAQRISEWIGTVGGIIVGEADDEILLNETSLSMLDHIESNPGVSQSAVADQLGVSLQTIYYSADELAGHDLIMAEKRYGNRRYFPAECGDEQYHIDRKLMNMPETTELVLETIQWLTHESDGVSNAAIAERIDRDPATVTHHLNRLEDNGLIVRSGHSGNGGDGGDGIHIDEDVVTKMNQ